MDGAPDAASRHVPSVVFERPGSPVPIWVVKSALMFGIVCAGISLLWGAWIEAALCVAIASIVLIGGLLSDRKVVVRGDGYVRRFNALGQIRREDIGEIRAVMLARIREDDSDIWEVSVTGRLRRTVFFKIADEQLAQRYAFAVRDQFSVKLTERKSQP